MSRQTIVKVDTAFNPNRRRPPPPDNVIQDRIERVEICQFARALCSGEPASSLPFCSSVVVSVAHAHVRVTSHSRRPSDVTDRLRARWKPYPDRL